MQSQCLAVALCAAVVAPVTGAPFVSEVDPGTLSTNVIEDFESLVGGPNPGTSYDNIISLNGISFGEMFAGQTLGFNGVYDVVTGTPAGPLSLLAGLPGQNLHIISAGGSNVLDGLGASGWPNQSAIGEGAVAVLFDQDQYEFGVTLAGAGPGASQVDFQFYARDGTLLETVSLSPSSSGPVAFRRTGGVTDLAGVVITNVDSGGLAFDNFRFYHVPMPGSLSLLALALLAARRRRRS
jgi:hypothetical protein